MKKDHFLVKEQNYFSFQLNEDISIYFIQEQLMIHL